MGMKYHKVITVFVLVSIWGSSSHAENRGEYTEKRTSMLKAEARVRTGGGLVLTAAERRANTALLAAREADMGPGRGVGVARGTTWDQVPFPPALHFFTAKPLIDNSKVFSIIKKMPKGAVLHLHDGSMASIEWLIKRTTYDPNCFMCQSPGGSLVFHFYQAPPKDAGCQWQQVVDARNKSGNATKFDEKLYEHLSLVTPDPDKAYPTQAVIWDKFGSIFDSLFGLIFYKPVFKDYLWRAMQEFHEDGAQYMEIRCLMSELYDLNGTKTSGKDFILTYQEVIEQFTEKYPDFMGAKIIISSSRSENTSVIMRQIKQTIELMTQFPGFVVGYDLVGREDSGHPLTYFLDPLLYPSQNGIHLPYFFHAGETDWEGHAVDENLLDALLLNTSRIGHGFAITKHPVAMEMASERDVPIEVNPISNQVLKLVSDLRNHPAATLIAQGRPLVIAPDDPALWGATGVSYDFYEAFMALGGATADLATLKKLTMDSIKYSAMNDQEKSQTLKVWTFKWEDWVTWLAKQPL